MTIMTIEDNSAGNFLRTCTKSINKSIAGLFIGTTLSAVVAFLVVKGFGDTIEWSLMYSSVAGIIIGTSVYWLMLNLNTVYNRLTDKSSINVAPIPTIPTTTIRAKPMPKASVTYIYEQK